MKILLLTQYFWPESFIINDVVRTLEEQGHEVVVLTGKPNYPNGDIYEGYKAFGIQSERYLNRVEVLRVPLFPRGNGKAKNLILNYLSFVFSGLFFSSWMLRGRKFDVIFVFGLSPIIQVIPAIFLKFIKKTKLIVWVQDLWPESLSATGFVRNKKILSAIGFLVRGIYFYCDKLLVQSRGFIEAVSKYSEREKIYYYPNSIRHDVLDVEINLPAELIDLLSKNFCVVFAGNLGSAQALETLVQAAEYLRDDPCIKLVLIGSGSRSDWLEEQKINRELDNLVLPGRFPMEAMPQIFDKASALLVSLNDAPAFSQTIPSKIQAYLAAGKPIIASINGEGAQVVLEAGAGVVSPAEQVLPLVNNIKYMKRLSISERNAMGESGKEYFDRNFEMKSQVRKLVDLLKCN
ncbi:glycosyltransferase family 4 protein [Comamonas aquatica]|uniref:glycosyltransferase family 4 protein n=1 Tax=Comamonas aquatica TaxID=225991 RepID=UPI00244D7680|nr:glycosyltransferase family 4 protein [Comamonas aquatica]MDH0382068.1 glycosyltransferase family 4 protein [Comamonas aquatica]MDH0430311.1 glycosyltransferase family 4 protein [Comamonas aquatica]MDH0941177.1 glycosyltransferase family 4 protein [Comamonas aquatica]